MVEVARIRVQLEGLDAARDQKAKGEEGNESGAAKRQREAGEIQAEEVKDAKKKQKKKRTLSSQIGRRAGQATSLAGRAGAPGAVTGAAQGLGLSVAGAILSRGPIIGAGVAAAQLLDTFEPLIQEGIRQALGPELGQALGIPVGELAVLIRKLKVKFSASISGIGDVNDLITDLNNAGGNIFDALAKDPGAVAAAYDFGETITKADGLIEKAFDREASARALLANVETAVVLAQEMGAILLNDAGFLGKLTNWLRKTMKP